MMEIRWFRRIGPGIAALGVVALIAGTTLGAAARPWTPPPCPTVPSLEARSVTVAGTWFRTDPVLDEGALRSNLVTIAASDGAAERRIALDAESFAAGPFGTTVLVGTDDGHISTMTLIDSRAGCAWIVARESSVIRRATLAPDGRTLYEMRVDRATRADLGIWRRSIDEPAEAVRVLDGLEPDARFGPTFATAFTWSAEGDRLVVRSCGMVACRIRVLDPAGGEHQRLADPGLGDVIGLTGDRLIVHGACRGLPCPVLSVRILDGARTVLWDDAGLAVLVVQPDGEPRVIVEAGHGGRNLRSVGVDGRDDADAGSLPAGRRLMPTDGRTDSGIALPQGWIALAADGRPSVRGSFPTLARHTPNGRAVGLDEVPR